MKACASFFFFKKKIEIASIYEKYDNMSITTIYIFQYFLIYIHLFQAQCTTIKSTMAMMEG